MGLRDRGHWYHEVLQASLVAASPNLGRKDSSGVSPDLSRNCRRGGLRDRLVEGAELSGDPINLLWCSFSD